MFLNIFSHVPLLQCLTHYPFSVHRIASRKFFVLLILASLPIIFTAVLAPVPDGDISLLQKLAEKFGDAISVSEQFVYTATFLTPILYLIYEDYADVPRDQLGERLSQGIKKIFKGYGLVALIALLLIMLTAAAFSSLKIDPVNFKKSFLNYYLATYSVPLYFFALYCWYLTLLDGAAGGGNFVGAMRAEENKTSKGFSNRIHSDGNQK